MANPSNPDASRERAPLALERFRALLDAYGAAPERWPEGERAAAERLLESSADARALAKEAGELDGLLDRLESAPPSPLLSARVLASAPRRRRPWRGTLAAAIPLAAAAALLLWIAGTSREKHTPVAALTSITLGEYTNPTDVLLESYGVDVSAAAMPSVGCADSALGCPNIDALDDSRSERPLPRRSRA